MPKKTNITYFNPGDGLSCKRAVHELWWRWTTAVSRQLQLEDIVKFK